jgi:hypothetical protein
VVNKFITVNATEFIKVEVFTAANDEEGRAMKSEKWVVVRYTMGGGNRIYHLF